MKYIYLMILLLIQSTSLYALSSDELVKIHSVSTTEMNNISTPKEGNLVFNSTENSLFVYTGSAWKRIKVNADATIVHAGSGITISGNGTVSTPYQIGI